MGVLNVVIQQARRWIYRRLGLAWRSFARHIIPETGSVATNISLTAYDTDAVHAAVGPVPDADADHADAWVEAFHAAVDDGRLKRGEHRETHNDTTETQHQYLATCMDFSAGHGIQSQPVLAIGSDPSPTTSTTDTSLTAPEGEFPIRDYNKSGRTISYEVFLAEQDAEGLTITEAGVRGPEGGLWNHGVFSSSFDKNTQKVITITVEFSFMDRSEVSAS